MLSIAITVENLLQHVKPELSCVTNHQLNTNELQEPEMDLHTGRVEQLSIFEKRALMLLHLV